VLAAVLLGSGIGAWGAPFEGSRAGGGPLPAEASSSTAPVHQAPAVDGVTALHDDAALYDVRFVDPDWGWAVGAQGVIWHTRDGGATWRRQASPSTATLRGAWFVDRRIGYAVGGTREPLDASTSSHGVVLATRDGGDRWQQLPAAVPLLEKVQFFSAERGIAVGCGNAARPAGIFVTRDGGRSWRPAGDGARQHWLAVDAIDGDNALLAGAGGAVGELNDGVYRVQPPREAAGRAARGLALVRAPLPARPPADGLPPVAAWLVGDGGLIAVTRDWGASWSLFDELPQVLRDNADWSCVAAAGRQAWIAGAPGSLVLHTPDGGSSWEAQPTGLRTPLHRLCFIDEQRGWAVGDLGVVIGTSDGGKTWRILRGGSRRAAVLALAAVAEGLPCHALARCAADEGYRTAVRVLTESPADGDGRSVVNDAALRLGAHAGSVASQSVLPDPRLQHEVPALLAELDRRCQGDAVARLRRDLTRQIRLWQPDVVLIPAAQGPSHHPLDPLVHRLALEAIGDAARPDADPDWAAAWKLPPWNVRRALAVLPPGQRGTHHVATCAPTRRLAEPLARLAAPGRALLVSSGRRSRGVSEEFLLVHGDGAGVPQDFLADLGIVAGGPARRAWEARPGSDTAAVLRGGLQRRNLWSLLETSAEDPAARARLAQLAESWDEESAAALLAELARLCLAAGHLQGAAETRELIVRRFPAHRESAAALAWLTAYYASSETARVDAPRGGRGEEAAGLGGASAETPRNAVQQAAAFDAGGRFEASPAPVTNLSPRQRCERSVELLGLLAGRFPLAYEQPAVRFPAAVAQGRSGQRVAAEQHWLATEHRDPLYAWQASAAAERWLRDGGERPPAKPVVRCRRADRPPQLDGRLDEPFWQGAAAILESRPPRPQACRPAEVRWAYDELHLYVALSCPHAAGVTYAADARPRPQDADLSPFDHVRLRLDRDRDYVTWFELAVDARGFVADACWGASSWNPLWYVAAETHAAAGGDGPPRWHVEAAIPWTELAENRPEPREAWAVAVERIVPRAELQTLAGPAANPPGPENFALLLFD
jgi:photosystem II stability/assembly factor-like uncharacterized protein